MIDLTINKTGLEHNLRKAKENRIIIPTIAQMQHPETIPEKIRERLKTVGLWDVDPLNLFRITWKNEAKESGGLFQAVPNYIELPPALTGVPCRIVAMVGKWFPTGCHKVGASFGCLAPRLVTGQFDATYHHAVWPSTGNYCRGGAFNSRLLGAQGVAILPAEMSQERFDWLHELGAEVIATPGCESNVKEIFDKTNELKQDPQYMIFNQFEEMGNPLWHYNVTGNALADVYEAIKRGVPFETIYNITKIDPWFLAKLQGLAETELALAGLRGGILTEELYRTAKMQGFLDKTVLRLTGLDALPCEKLRASYKMVDTCAAEFSAKTPYFYSTFDEENEAAQFIAEHPSDRKKVLVFGSGPIRIGQGIEFDYCSVHCTWVLKSHGCEAVIVNNNPETVSTDFDTGDRLYFDPLTEESVEHIIATEKPWACVVQFGGQTAIKLTKHLTKLGVKILGTSADAIDEAEDRERFDALLEKCGIPRPQGHTVFTCEEALAAGAQLGYPVLLRPSYVLGGQNMIIAYNENDVREYMAIITSHVDMSNPVLVDKYLMGTECEVDAICDGEDFLIPGMMEHIERAGIHSGDSISVYPPQNLKQKIKGTIVDYTGRLARALNVVGLMNIQFVVYNNEVFIIEVNPRSSRTVPYISKVTGVPMVELAVRCMLGEKLRDMGYGTGLYPTGDYCAVKVPVFSFEKLHDVDTQLGPEMKSTGEVLGIDKTFEDALLKGLVGAGYSLRQPTPGKCVILTVKDADKRELVDIAWQLKDMGYKLYGTSGTAYYLGQNMVACNEVRKLSEARPNIMDLFESGLVDYVISTSSKGRIPSHDSVKMRRKAVELSIPCLTAIDTARVLVKCLRSGKTLADVDLVDISTI